MRAARLFSPIFILFLFAHVRACPLEVQSLCRCTDRLDGLELNCSRVDIVDLGNVLRVAQAQLGRLKLLSINNSDIPTLSANTFLGLYIRKLSIWNSAIRIVEAKAFDGLEGVLQELSLANNRIEKFPSEALSGLSGILRLDFSNNRIGELTAESCLPRLPKVSSFLYLILKRNREFFQLFDINLSYNQIDIVHKSFFDNVKGSLQTINLGHNNISTIPASGW